MPPRPFLDPSQIGDVPLAHVLAVLEAELALRDRLYPLLLERGELLRSEAERLYRGLVGARRVVLDAMQLALPLGRTP